MLDLDDLDIKILKELLKNARLSYRAIAGKVGVAIGTVISRIKRMEKDKEISQDEHKRALDQLQKITDVFMAEIEMLGKDKEQELSEV